jgi:phosphoribosylanthranilate isomerase
MALVKICGIKTQKEVDILNKYKPDFAGFVLSESKRKIDIEKAASLTHNLSKEIKAVGVFVNEPASYVIEACEMCRLSVIQLHGEESSDYINEIRNALEKDILIWKAIRVRDDTAFDRVDKTNIDAILLDAFSKDVSGGTGETFNWNLAQGFSRDNKIVLAGGLNSSNVLSAIRMLRPFCVDVSSGVETDGYKSELKVRDFITEASRGANL